MRNKRELPKIQTSIFGGNLEAALNAIQYGLVPQLRVTCDEFPRVTLIASVEGDAVKGTIFLTIVRAHSDDGYEADLTPHHIIQVGNVDPMTGNATPTGAVNGARAWLAFEAGQHALRNAPRQEVLPFAHRLTQGHGKKGVVGNTT